MLPRASLGAPTGRILLRARTVLPIVTPPIEDGAVLVSGHHILRVGPWPELQSLSREDTVDLGNVVLMPGLINCHCHLDYTDMAGQISPSKSFADWIKAILALKAHRTYSDYALSWLRGAKMLLTHGVTTVADVEAVPELLPDVLSATPLRVCSFIELTGVRSRRPAAEVLTSALHSVSEALANGAWIGLSPHAPYSTTSELLRLCAETARQRNWLLTTHVSESAEEFDMFVSGKGPMFDWLKLQRSMADCHRGRSPVAHLEAQGILGPNLMAVHVNFLKPDDAGLLARRQVNVVHCPRSHAYFDHAPFPRLQLRDAGVNVCLGTDSLATVVRKGREKVELNLFAEMQTMLDQDPALPPEEIVRFATVNAARALGISGQVGELSPGAKADLITIPRPRRAQDPYESVVRHGGTVPGVMINGVWILEPSSVVRVERP